MEKEQKSEMNLAMAAQIRAERAGHRGRITVKELAMQSGIAYGTLNRILSGERDINVTQIARIAAALDTTPEKLVAGAVERMGGLDALVSEVQSKNVTPLRPVEDFTLEELDKERYAATRDEEAETDEQFD